MEPFDIISRANADYIEQLYQQYHADPHSIEPQWRAFFAGFDAGGSRGAPAAPSPGSPDTHPKSSGGDGAKRSFKPAAGIGSAEAMEITVGDLVHTYRELGHTLAKVDPLGHFRQSHPLLELPEFGLSIDDLDRRVSPGGFVGAFDGTLRDLIEKLRATYCSSIGVEYMTISDKTQREWIQQRIEPIYNRPVFSTEESLSILRQVAAAQGFEEFLHTKYVGTKRFSLEGAEALIPLLNSLADDGATLGVDEMVLGMAHRGRMNVLANVLHKPAEIILGEFEGTTLPPTDEGDGDVKYHLGYSNDRVTPSGRKLHMSLGFNPSHLELVNPVIVGIVRAKQVYKNDTTERMRVVPILIHGDAAFCGQGIVQETLALSEMPYYRTGGTIHVIINNQIGFTTFPRQGRFTPYPTDVAKMIQAPIFHVNGDDPEACVWVAKLAIAFRQRFHCDVMIDMWSYRRHGHNEADEPSFTQPVMYREIAQHPRPRELLANRLFSQGTVDEESIQRIQDELRQRLDKAQQVARELKPRQAVTSLGGVWNGMQRGGDDAGEQTQISEEMAKKIGLRATDTPDGFNLHPKLTRLMQARREMCQGKLGIDWGCAEMLALGSLVLEGTPIRFVGQDAQRGTFSHRHAALRDYQTGEKYVPLANLDPAQAPIIIVNTMLSELAVLGFEYGFSSADPRNLVVWEAQFGDFVNGAQAIIDQFIVAAESKWQKMCGLVMLLPHGYEGQGPEHSNAYLERFLSLCADDNIQVVYPSQPSQYFHVLRRQMKRGFRKPLILMMPKSLLRDERYASRLEEFTEGQFQLVIDDPAAPARERVRRLLLCSGKIFHLLNGTREKRKIDSVALVRVEQLYPYPQKQMQQILSRYHGVTEVCWVQEEPKNRGGWTFMSDRLEPMLAETQTLTYVGRDASASPATGSFRMHQIEEEEIVAHALEIGEHTIPLTGMPATPREAAAKAMGVSD